MIQTRTYNSGDTSRRIQFAKENSENINRKTHIGNNNRKTQIGNDTSENAIRGNTIREIQIG